MDEEVAVSRSKNEACAELERIFPEPMLAVAGGFRAGTRFGVIKAKEMEQVCRFQSHSPVGGSLGIDQKRKCNTGFVAEQPGIVHIAQTDRDQSRAGLLELALVLAQLRDVLATDDSAVMPQEDDNGRILFPERAESDFTAVSFRQYDIRQLPTDRFRHGPILIGEASGARSFCRQQPV
jgi:hypothetical protein